MRRVLIALFFLGASPGGAAAETVLALDPVRDPYGFGGALAAVAEPEAAAALPPYVPPAHNAGRAFAEVGIINGTVWSYNRFIRAGGGAGFRIGMQSWKQNLLNGFEWDDNTFNTNQFAHPYHGSLYYNSARANGFDYWQSAPFAFAGSFAWEYFGETHHPSINDWFATSIGGLALGETLYRLSNVLTDNTATGGGRRAREIAGLVINPMRGINRLVRGEAFRVSQNPPDRKPLSYGISYQAGLRTTSEEHVWQADTTRAYIAIQARYGDPFRGEYKKPFDSFEFNLQVNFRDASSIGSASARGILFGTEVHKSETAQHLFAVYQHYDYINTNAFVFGGQSVGVSFLSRVSGSPTFEVRSGIDLDVLLLGATNSDHANISGRSYDYGPGLGFKFSGSFVFRGHPFLTLTDGENWIHVFNGTRGDHILSQTHIRVEIPIEHGIGAGVEYVLFRANRNYRDFPSVDRRLPEVRAALAWNM